MTPMRRRPSTPPTTPPTIGPVLLVFVVRTAPVDDGVLLITWIVTEPDEDVTRAADATDVADEVPETAVESGMSTKA